MKKINTQKAMTIIGGEMGCLQVYNKTLVDGKTTCNITVVCQDKWGDTTTSSKPTDLEKCA
ncbi:DUF4762 family protein [Serratia sp. L9]|uniref:DUF4762 family protein n=1 Tax=Serratia sp. L9 TaxID=3423946 RepID=UPI003D678128